MKLVLIGVFDAVEMAGGFDAAERLAHGLSEKPGVEVAGAVGGYAMYVEDVEFFIPDIPDRITEGGGVRRGGVVGRSLTDESGWYEEEEE